MTNKEIIMEIEKIIDDYKNWITSKDRKGLLNTEVPFWDRSRKAKAIDQILQLIPEEGEVIAEGKVILNQVIPNYWIESGEKLFSCNVKGLYEAIKKYLDKKIKIIIREVKQ